MHERQKRIFFNADDFGISEGVNRGIREVLEDGRVVKSTSVMVYGPAAGEVKEIDRIPNISIGLHLDLTGEGLQRWLRFAEVLTWSENKIIDAFDKQIGLFSDLLGRLPDHIDSHHHIHRIRGFREVVRKFGYENHIPIRAINSNFNVGFHGRTWRHRNIGRGIAPDNLIELISNLSWGTHEIACHPGHADEGLIFSGSSYIYQREIEINTLRSPEVIDYLAANTDTIEIINSKQI